MPILPPVTLTLQLSFFIMTLFINLRFIHPVMSILPSVGVKPYLGQIHPHASIEHPKCHIVHYYSFWSILFQFSSFHPMSINTVLLNPILWFHTSFIHSINLKHTLQTYCIPLTPYHHNSHLLTASSLSTYSNKHRHSFSFNLLLEFGYYPASHLNTHMLFVMHSGYSLTFCPCVLQ